MKYLFVKQTLATIYGLSIQAGSHESERNVTNGRWDENENGASGETKA